ncbi:MAG: hypothetical protein HY704_02100 [Gemmatimonadetes bacterium]|nr:hypothetical protein [Gemmatimonadota bacterium]
MHVWHLTPDAPRSPRRVSPGQRVVLGIGTWPIEPGQVVWVAYRLERGDGSTEQGRTEASWQRNEGPNSYWRAQLGPFVAGDRVEYEVHGRSPRGDVRTAPVSFRVGAAIHLALLWHQHQPLYKQLSHPSPKGSYRSPWVRLHAIRDYYSMAAMVAQHPDIHLTINLTPSLLWQLEDYLEHGATDRSVELTLKPAGQLTADEREEVIARFFAADWRNKIVPHSRYKELFAKRQAGRRFTVQDLRDLQMWFNLTWFGSEFQQGDVKLITGETVSVRRFVEKGRGFRPAEIEEMVAEQYKIMRAVVPIHRALQDRGQIEVSTTPFFHPILPLLVDSDQATIDREGCTHPPRFAYPDDADAQVTLAIEYYARCFGRAPSGMWPAEGAVSQAVVPIFARHGLRWIATDAGVLARSGRWGYDTGNPDVVCQPYRAESGSQALSVFFRDAPLSDAIGFRYDEYADSTEAANDFVHQIKERFVRRFPGTEDRVLTVALDGENAWGAYRDDGRPFLHALYSLLERDPEIATVTFREYLDGDAARQIPVHPLADQPGVQELFTGSWIDEMGSRPGVDLGTWIGEEEENRAWELLGEARRAFAEAGARPESAPEAFRALYAAEGSDWFWWFGTDQSSGNDEEFDDLFRDHLRSAYRSLGREAPPELELHIASHAVTWTFARPVPRVQRADRLRIRTSCPGVLSWRLDDGEARSAEPAPVGGVMAGLRRYDLTLGPFAPPAHGLRFQFRCRCGEPQCAYDEMHRADDEYLVEIVP